MRLSLSTVLGVMAGVILIIMGVTSATDNWKVFLSLGSLKIVLGGTIASTFIGYKWRYIWRAFLNIFEIFIESGINSKTLKHDVETMLSWAELAQEKGKEAYDEISQSLGKKDTFSKYILSLMSTGYTVDEVRSFGENSIEENYYRTLTGANILNTMSAAAPAFGMVGTLIGLIAMLGKMDTPSEIGPGLAVALTTTLYGVLLARFIFDPTSTKVKQIYSIQRFREYLFLEGLLKIMENHSTFYIRDFLNSYLDRNNMALLDSEK